MRPSTPTPAPRIPARARRRARRRPATCPPRRRGRRPRARCARRRRSQSPSGARRPGGAPGRGPPIQGRWVPARPRRSLPWRTPSARPRPAAPGCAWRRPCEPGGSVVGEPGVARPRAHDVVEDHAPGAPCTAPATCRSPSGARRPCGAPGPHRPLGAEGNSALRVARGRGRRHLRALGPQRLNVRGDVHANPGGSGELLEIDHEDEGAGGDMAETVAVRSPPRQGARFCREGPVGPHPPPGDSPEYKHLC